MLGWWCLDGGAWMCLDVLGCVCVCVCVSLDGWVDTGHLLPTLMDVCHLPVPICLSDQVATTCPTVLNSAKRSTD